MSEQTRPDTRPGISRELLPLADFLDGRMDRRMGVRDDWYPLSEAWPDSLRGFTGIDER